MQWFWGMPKRELRRPEIGGMRHHAIQNLRDRRIDRGYGAGEPCCVGRREGRFPWVAIFTDGSILAFTEETARESLRTERDEAGKPVRVDGTALSKAVTAWDQHRESLRTVYHGD